MPGPRPGGNRCVWGRPGRTEGEQEASKPEGDSTGGPRATSRDLTAPAGSRLPCHSHQAASLRGQRQVVFPLWTEALTVGQSSGSPQKGPEVTGGLCVGSWCARFSQASPGAGWTRPSPDSRPAQAPLLEGDLATAGSSLVSASHPSLGLLNLTRYRPQRREGVHCVTECHLGVRRTHGHPPGALLPLPPKGYPQRGPPSEHPLLRVGLKVQRPEQLWPPPGVI